MKRSFTYTYIFIYIEISILSVIIKQVIAPLEHVALSIDLRFETVELNPSVSTNWQNINSMDLWVLPHNIYFIVWTHRFYPGPWWHVQRYHYIRTVCHLWQIQTRSGMLFSYWKLWALDLPQLHLNKWSHPHKTKTEEEKKGTLRKHLMTCIWHLDGLDWLMPEVVWKSF